MEPTSLAKHVVARVPVAEARDQAAPEPLQVVGHVGVIVDE
jgi:hypothetical protein